MLAQGTFSHLVKNGVFFSVATDDRVFTGDLYYDFALKEFQLRGIPSLNGVKRHCFKMTERGPMKIDLLVNEILEEQKRDTENYNDFRFKDAKVSSSFLTWVEEFYSDRTVLHQIYDTWEIHKQLAWVK